MAQELNIHLSNTISTRIVRWKFHRLNIHGRVAILKSFLINWSQRYAANRSDATIIKTSQLMIGRKWNNPTNPHLHCFQRIAWFKFGKYWNNSCFRLSSMGRFCFEIGGDILISIQLIFSLPQLKDDCEWIFKHPQRWSSFHDKRIVVNLCRIPG